MDAGRDPKLDHPIKFGPVTVNGEAVAGTGATGTPLHLYPDATSMQHSEIAGTRDAIDAFRERLPRILRGLLANANYEIIKRSILPHSEDSSDSEGAFCTGNDY